MTLLNKLSVLIIFYERSHMVSIFGAESERERFIRQTEDEQVIS